MRKEIRRFLIGSPLKSDDLKGERLGVLWGLPIMSSDAISSVAYAGQEILLVMLPVIGAAAYGQVSVLSGAIIALLLLLMLSYRQIIDSYPNGGGAFIVAKENLGIAFGITAGAALAVDYILTVAVSVSSGIEQLTSAFPAWQPYSVEIAAILILLLTMGNLRGIRESALIFGIPAYLFIFGMLIMVAAGFIKLIGGYVPPEPTVVSLGKPITTILMLRAFSNGCSALTGIEAVSNAVPNFKDPSTKVAKKVLLLLSILILVLFGGTSLLANQYRVIPGAEGAMLILMAKQIFGQGFMYYYITGTTFIILIMAANTAFSGFPMLISVMAREEYVPRQLSRRGDRLSYDNGIIVLAVVALALVAAFRANVSNLIGLYAIGVFISFTLSQSGMFMKWYRERGANWIPKAVLNGMGAVVTAIVVVIIAFTKFTEGAWIVVIVIPVLIFLMMKVKHHYEKVASQLRMTQEDYERIDVDEDRYENHVIVPIDGVNKSSIRALRYANTISSDITAFCVVLDADEAIKVKERYERLHTQIPLVLEYSPYRQIVEPLLAYIRNREFDYPKGSMITVILPQFRVTKNWHRILHNNSRFYIEQQLLKHKHIVVATMPLQLKQ